MGKERNFFGFGKWLVLLLFVATLVVALKQPGETEKLNFFQVGKEVIKESIAKHMLYSQSTILGFVKEQESHVGNAKTVTKIESFLPFEERAHVLILEKETMEQFTKENSAATEENKEEVYLVDMGGFHPAEKKQIEIDINQYRQKEELVKRFFTVDPTTEVTEDFFDVEKMSSTDCSIDMASLGPQILIYHTHSQEAFADSEAGKEEDTIVGAGEVLAGYLTDYGFSVYHHKGKFDTQSRDYAYSNALPEIEKILQENPQIQVVIDLHRDAVAENTRLVTEIQNKQVAKVMFFNGLGRIRDKGEISYLKNPYLRENLAFSFQMKVACDEYYPGLARNTYLRAYRYNMHLCPRTLLIELGAQTNTKEEIHGALAPLAHALYMVLSGENRE